MPPLNQVGFVQQGPLEGWYIKVQEMKQQGGYLVSRARNATMDLTLVMDGIFPTVEKVEAFFKENAPVVAWL